MCRGTRSSVLHPVRRAADIEVDLVITEILADPGRGREIARIRAAKLQRRAARTGFDWPDASGPRAKIDEELAELEAESDPARQAEELGDLLFAVVNLARFLNIDAEEALRQANRKFERRFRAIEQAPGFNAMSLEEMESLWVAAKAGQADSSA